jgi:hypothetical protein
VVWLAVALVAQLLGTLALPWDVANHIENIRDRVLYPAHLGILAGLALWALAGTMSVIRRPEGTPLRARRGGLLVAIGAITAFLTFPLDAAWHELFGIDVTLWGPTHLVMMLGGSVASFGTFTMIVDHARTRGRGWNVAAMLAAAFPLSAMLAYLLEYAFDVPQFSLLYPTLIGAFATSLALVMARALLGRGAALVAGAGYLAISVGIASTWLTTLGYNATHVRIMLPTALCVELAFWLAPRKHAAWIAGVLAAVGGMASEWAYNKAFVDHFPSHVLTDTPWVWVAAIALGVIAAFAGNAIATSLRVPFGASAAAAQPRRVAAWFAAGLAVTAVLLALPIMLATSHPVRVDVQPANLDAANTTFMFTIPDSAMDDVQSASIVSSHGGDLLRSYLHRVGADTWRTTTPSPVGGEWFTSLELMRTNDLQGVVLRAPGGSIYGDSIDLQGGAKTTQQVDPVPTSGHSAIIPVFGYLIVVAMLLSALLLTAWALLPAPARRTSATA